MLHPVVNLYPSFGQTIPIIMDGIGLEDLGQAHMTILNYLHGGLDMLVISMRLDVSFRKQLQLDQLPNIPGHGVDGFI